MHRADYLKEFEKITSDMLETTKKKNADYSAGSNDAFGNFRMVEHLGIADVEVGMLTRMTDKISRISSFVKNGELQVKDESVYDTLKDLAVYSIIMAIYIKSESDINMSNEPGEVVLVKGSQPGMSVTPSPEENYLNRNLGEGFAAWTQRVADHCIEADKRKLEGQRI